MRRMAGDGASKAPTDEQSYTVVVAMAAKNRVIGALYNLTSSGQVSRKVKHPHIYSI